MQMTTEEIIRNYTEAKDKSKQIGILADLNGCDKEKIRSILRTKGVPLPTKGRPKKETTEKKIESYVKKVTFKNIDTGEETVACAEEKPLEEKPFIPEVVKGLVIERISQIEFEITKLKLDKEELEDFLESFNE